MSTGTATAHGTAVKAREQVRKDRVASRLAARRLVLVILLIGPLVVGELTVRALIATHRLPTASAPQGALEISWTNYERVGPADIVILGDSLARQGVHPATLASNVGRRLGRRVTVFNLATPGAGFRLNGFLVEQLARDGRLPRVAIIGVSADALERREEGTQRALRSAMGRLTSGCTGVRGLEETLSCRLESVSALWRWRGQLDRLVASALSPVPSTEQQGGILLEADGFGNGRSVRSQRALDRQLARALDTTTDLTTTSNSAPRYADLVRFLEDHGVTVVPVFLPYSPLLERELEDAHPGWHERRDRTLDEMSARAGLTVAAVGPVEGWWRLRDAHDIKHLSLPGARRFTNLFWGLPEVQSAIVNGLAEPLD